MEIENSSGLSTNTSNGQVKNTETYAMRGRDRIKWPFKQTRINLLRSDLDRLKSDLNLMITVIRHAREMQEKREADR